MMVSPLLTLAELMQPIADAEKLDLFFRLLAGAIRGQSASSAMLDQLAGSITQGFKSMSDANAQFSAKLDQIKADVAAEKTVNDSAIALIQGFSGQLADLKAQLAAAGVQPAQLAALDELDASVKSNTAALAAAVPQNTPAANGDAGQPAPAPAPTPALEPAPADPNAPAGAETAPTPGQPE